MIGKKEQHNSKTAYLVSVSFDRVHIGFIWRLLSGFFPE
jgi:hypothetical protein